MRARGRHADPSRPAHAAQLLSLLCALALPPRAAGEEDPEQTVVVTASRSEQERFEADRSVELLDRKRLEESQAQSVPEAMQEAVGVHLQQTNRGSGTPFLRGLVGPQNLILVDGVRINTSTHRTGPNQYLALQDPFALARIEVLRGPSSVLHGNGAMGGVMHLLTLSPAAGPGAPDASGRARARFASADLSAGLGLQVSPSLGGEGLRLGAHLDRFGPLRAGGGAELPLSDYGAGYWQAKWLHADHAGWTLTGAYLGAALRDTGRTDAAGVGDLRFYDDDDHLAYLSFRLRGEGALRALRVTASYHRLDERMRRFGCQKGADGTVADLAACFALEEHQLTRRQRARDTVDVLGADADVELSLWADRLRLQAGAEVQQEWVGSSLETASAASGFVFEAQPRGNYSDGSTYLGLGVFLHAGLVLHDFGPEVGRLRANGGLRFSHFAAFAPDVPDLGDVAYAHQGVVGAAGLQWLRPGVYNLYLSFAQGFRAPNLQETTQMGDTGTKFNVPNPALGPERGDHFELGGRVDLGFLELELAGFCALGADAITWEPATHQGQAEIDGKPVTRLANAQSGLTYGLEGGLTARWWRLGLSAGAAWMRGEVTDRDGATTPARWIPPFSGLAGLRYDHPDPGVYAQVLVRWAARQDRLHPQDRQDPRICETAPFSGLLEDPCDGTPGWATLNLRVGWRIDEQLTARLALNNLTDARYRTHGSGIDAPGLDVRLSLDAAF